MQEAVGRSFYVPYPECELQVTVPESSHETHTYNINLPTLLLQDATTYYKHDEEKLGIPP